MRFNRLGAFTLGVVITAVSVGAVSFVNAAGNGTLKACANKTTGVMRYISKGSCKKTETLLSWNQMGSQGLPGAAGTNGTNGAAGTKGDTGTTGAKGETGAAGANDVNTNSQIKNICGDNRTTACAIGLKGPGGGIVFMTPSTPGNTTGLFYEAAPSTWSSPSGDPVSAWCNNTTDWLGFSSTQFGTGAMDGAFKTTLMLGGCTSGAANLVDAYTATVNGVVYGDWFLPSRGELRQMAISRENLRLYANSGLYWSSSERNDHSSDPVTTSAIALYVTNPDGGIGGGWSKSDSNGVRPVRAF